MSFEPQHRPKPLQNIVRLASSELCFFRSSTITMVPRIPALFICNFEIMSILDPSKEGKKQKQNKISSI